MHVAKLPSIRNATGILYSDIRINDSKKWKISSTTEAPTRSSHKLLENQIYNWIKNNKNIIKL